VNISQPLTTQGQILHQKSTFLETLYEKLTNSIFFTISLLFLLSLKAFNDPWCLPQSEVFSAKSSLALVFPHGLCGCFGPNWTIIALLIPVGAVLNEADILFLKAEKKSKLFAAS